MEESQSDNIRIEEWTQRENENVQHAGVDFIVATEGDVDGDRDRLATDASAHTDDDNWSQQVETDEILRLSSSAILDDVDGSLNTTAMESIRGGSVTSNNADPSTLTVAANLAPQREVPTLKEKLVERERQRRVETERARLTRQFALSSNDGGAIDEDDTEHGGSALRENGSVAGTVGEGSSIAQVDPDDDEGQNLTYPMERFLQEQGGVFGEDAARETSRDNGVLMERFLKEPVVVVDPQGPSGDTSDHIDRNVVFDAERQLAYQPRTEIEAQASSSIAGHVVMNDPPVPMLSEGLGTDTDGSLRNQSIEVEQLSAADNQSDGSVNSEEPRFLRLTEAEIQEMASIDEMSRSNAPPSDRDDDISFVGELISDFGGPVIDTAGSASQGTGTTAMESASADHSHSERDVSAQGDNHSFYAPATASISSHVFSSAGASVAANPPSDIGADEPPVSPLPNTMVNLNHRIDLPPGEIHSGLPPDREVIDQGASLNLRDQGPTEAVIVNRQIRPGMNDPRRLHRPPSTPMRRSSSAPDLNFEVDGFDYDKDVHSPGSGLGGQDADANDLWSPGSNMSWSPPYRRSGPPNRLHVPELLSQKKNYGAMDDRDTSTKLTGTSLLDDRQPLLPDIPKEIVASPHSRLDNVSRIERVFRQIRLNDSRRTGVDHTNNGGNLERTMLKRAFPERLMVLSVTLVLEIPVLFAIFGGSDQLCSVLGRSKYQLLIGLFPMCTALSGNVGLQSSSCTIRAVTSGFVSQETFGKWILQETSASLYLGVAIGTVVGAIAFWLSGFHFTFALTIMVAQSTSILSAGLTGTLAPFVSTYLFDRKGQGWEGPLVTAIQDLIGALTLVTISCKILSLLGPMEVDPNDSCGWGNS